MSSETNSETNSKTGNVADLTGFRRQIRVGTRVSALALAQTEIVVNALASQLPDCGFSVVAKESSGDRILDRPLSASGDKGLFVADFDEALLANEIDIAVHSLKDLPVALAQGTSLVYFSKRADARDVLVFEGEKPDFSKPLGTASPRRTVQARALFGVGTVLFRGNVNTRLKKLSAGEGGAGATILAAAGIERLGVEGYTLAYLSPEEMVPCAGQGIIAVTARSDDKDLAEMLLALGDPDSRIAATAERAFVQACGATCASPVGAYATVSNGSVRLIAMYAASESDEPRYGSAEGPAVEAVELAKGLAGELMRPGGGKASLL